MILCGSVGGSLEDSGARGGIEDGVGSTVPEDGCG